MGYTQSSHVGIIPLGCSSHPMLRAHSRSSDFWNPGSSFALRVPDCGLNPVGRNSTAPSCPGRGTTSLCLPRHCHLPALFPAPRFLTTAISSQHLKDNCGYKYLPHNPAQPSLFPDLEITISVVSLNLENVPGFHHPAPFLVLLDAFILVTSDQNCKQYPGFGDGMGLYGGSEIFFPPNSMALVLVALGRQGCTQLTLTDAVISWQQQK